MVFIIGGSVKMKDYISFEELQKLQCPICKTSGKYVWSNPLVEIKSKIWREMCIKCQLIVWKRKAGEECRWKK